jgi:hypothetical protein
VRDNPLDGKNDENMKNGVALKFDSYSVYSDNNGDEIVNKGETVRLRVYLKNTGTNDANAVRATFSTSSSYVSDFSPTAQVSYGYMYAGVSVFGNTDITFTVSNTTPAGTQIPINISIVDDSGNTWTDNFNVPVEETTAQIAFDTYNVYSDNNGDKIINKGETVTLEVYLKNIGTSTSRGVKATFSTTSSYVSGFTPTTPITYGYGYMYAETSVSGNTDIKFTVSNTTPVGTQIPINISIVDESGNTWTDSFNVTVEEKTAQIAFDNYSVYSDNNGDKIINKGETVTLEVYLKNIGTSSAIGVKATFSTNSSYVSGFTPTTQITYGYGYMYAGTSVFGNTDIKFTVSSATPVGTQIPINISIVDDSGNTWTDIFYAVVGSDAADIAYSSYTVVADYNSNQKIEVGETVYLQVYLKNIGSGAANSVKATFSESSSYISGLAPTTQIDYGNFTGGQSKYGQGGYDFSVYYTIKFTVSTSTPANSQIPINISIVDESSHTWNQSFNITVY